jgi:hypothetical protein
LTNEQVICCRPSRAEAEADPTTRAALARCAGLDVDFVQQRPGKEIDALLAGRVVVIGDDQDLAAVVLRLLRRELLGAVIVGYATGKSTGVTELWSLPVGAAAVDLALGGDPDLVPVVRNDVGGVLVGTAWIGPIDGTVYLDERRIVSGRAAGLLVEPNAEKGLAVTVVPRRFLAFGRRSQTYPGRAVQIGTVPAEIISDGRVYDRKMDRWTFYKHTEPLRLVRGVL